MKPTIFHILAQNNVKNRLTLKQKGLFYHSFPILLNQYTTIRQEKRKLQYNKIKNASLISIQFW